MKSKKILTFVIFLSILSSISSGYAQTVNIDVFAPFVSRLKARAEKTQIVLTWDDSKDVKGVNIIYRYTEEITPKNIEKAKVIATVPQGIETYTDIPPTTDKYFYAVLIKTNLGKLYKVLIPYRNKTLKGVAVKTLATEKQLATKITKITATPEKNSIRIQFLSSKKNRDLLLFRSTTPLKTLEDLLKAASPILIEGGKTEYTDYPIPGIKYYYAVIDAELFKIGTVKLIPGENTTKTYVMIPLSPENTGLPLKTYSRPSPLPYLLISRDIVTGKELVATSPFMLPKKQKLDRATEKAVKNILAGIMLPKPKKMRVEILKEDRVKKTGREDYTLYKIVKDKLARGKFKEAEKLLYDFLSTYHSKDIETRAHFYLAQSYYFQKKYKKAFIEFLMAQSKSYSMIEPWLDACYRALMETDTEG